MPHGAIEQIFTRAERAKEDSDFTYFFSLLLAAEALAKTTVLGFIACLAEDKDRHRYRLEYQLAHADGLGDRGRVLEDALTGPASQFLISDARPEQTELAQLHKEDSWQYQAVSALKLSLDHLGLGAEEVPAKSDMKRWFRLFASLRNGTRAHGATPPGRAAGAAIHLRRSIDLFYTNHALFKRSWAYLYRNFSGKYRLSTISETTADFEHLKRTAEKLVA
jgi:hypothetical protein